MELKKSKAAAIENYRSSWLLMGFVTVLSFMFVSFEWTGHGRKMLSGSLANDPIFEEILTPITFQQEKLMPPPPPEALANEIIKVVGNEAQETVSTIASTEPIGAGVYIPPKVDPVVEEVVEEPVIFVTAEVMPEFPGGTAALMQYLGKNIHYPAVAQENGVQGKVIVQFIVDVDGSIVNPVVVRSVDPYLDKEAIRVIASMPKWKPGMQRNKPVRVKYTVPVAFRLQ